MEELEKELDSVTPPDIGSMERCSSLLHDLRTNPLAEWFLEPVDHVALGLTDYPQASPNGTASLRPQRRRDLRTYQPTL